MKIRNLRTGVIGEVRPNVAKFLISIGRAEEVKPEKKIEKKEEKPEKKAEKKEEKKPASKNTYKTKDMKAEA